MANELVNLDLDGLKAELVAKFSADHIETERTIAALVSVDKDFGNGNVAVTYFRLLYFYTTEEGFFVGTADLGQVPKYSTIDKEKVEQWRALRNSLFGEAPKGILNQLIMRDPRPEDISYLIRVNKIGQQINKSMKAALHE